MEQRKILVVLYSLQETSPYNFFIVLVICPERKPKNRWAINNHEANQIIEIPVGNSFNVKKNQRYTQVIKTLCLLIARLFEFTVRTVLNENYVWFRRCQ